jgi:hypothetical protein
MNKEEQLHQLIHSMSSSEQRDYVKISKASIGKEPKRSMHLFRVLRSIYPYDSVEIEKKLKTESFSAQPHRIRNYLFNSIINFLDHSYSHDPHAELLKLLRHAYLLKGKKLYPQCLKVLDKVESICKEHKKYHFHLEVIEIRKSVESEQQLKYSAMAMQTEAMLPIATQLTETIRARLICYRMLDLLYQKGQADQQRLRAQYYELYQDVVMRKDILVDEPVYYLAKQIYGIVTHDYKLAEEGSQSLFQLAIHKPHQLKDMAEAVRVSHNHANFYLVRSRFTETQTVIDSMDKHLGSKKLNSETKFLFDITINMTKLALMVYDHRNRFQISLYQDIEKFFVGNEKKLSFQHLYGFYTHSAVIWLYQDDPIRSLGFVNKLMNEPAFSKLGEMVASRISILNMTVHWRLKHYDLLENLVHNRQRRSRFSDSNTQETVLLRYYHEAVDRQDSKEWRRHLIADLQNIQSSRPNEMRTFGMDYLYYFSSIIK